VSAADLESRALNEHASLGQTSARTVQHDVEPPRANERDHPAARHLLFRIVVSLVRRMVEATDGEVGCRVEELVTVQRFDSVFEDCNRRRETYQIRARRGE
jgi:hypothetical protein